VADALFGFVAHPLPVVAHILGEPLRAAVGLGKQPLFLARFWVDRRTVGKLGRDLDHGLVDEYRHRVEVTGVALQPQALRLQR
jgi:hypothetical protein